MSTCAEAGGASACPDGLVCLCGLCTLACTDDTACGAAAVGAGAVCTDVATCATGGRTCTRSCAENADCGDAVCLAGRCVPPVDGGSADAGTRTDGETPSDCAGVTILRDAVEYCVGPDSSRFTCPARLPVRAVLNGAAVCGVAAPEDWILRGVAREALQTGRIQSLSDIARVVMAPEATHWPGLAGGARAEGTAVVMDYGGAWFSGDEGPISCGVQFDHLEIEPAAEGNGFLVSAWSNVVQCGEPQNGAVEEIPTPVAFTLPVQAGRYPVTLRQGAGIVAGPTLLVAQDAACPAEPPALDDCFTGFLFAECGGDLPPVLFHNDETLQDAWFNGGCPAAGFTRPIECDHTTATCPGQHIGWGPDVWNRDRDMVLTLAVDQALEPPAAPTVECTCETPPCLGRRRFCNDTFASGYSRPAVAPTDPAAPQNGLVVLRLRADGSQGDPSGHDWLWVLEADTERAQARVCLLQTNDAEVAGPPACAISGEVTFDRDVRTRGDAADVHGRAVATFDGVPGRPRETIVIDARF